MAQSSYDEPLTAFSFVLKGTRYISNKLAYFTRKRMGLILSIHSYVIAGQAISSKWDTWLRTVGYSHRPLILHT